jgi:hypothetical protein
MGSEVQHHQNAKRNYSDTHNSIAKRDTFLRLCFTTSKPAFISFHDYSSKVASIQPFSIWLEK